MSDKTMSSAHRVGAKIVVGRVPQDDRLLNILHACQNGRMTCRKAAERIEDLFARRSVGPSWFVRE